MNGISSPSIHFKQFVPPAIEPLLGFKSVIFWGHNILTLGIDAAATTVAKARHARQLKIIQDDLQSQVAQFNERWDDLESTLSDILGEMRHASEKDTENAQHLKGRLDKLSLKVEQLQEETLEPKVEAAATLSEIALGIIAFLGQWIANIVTLGLYGVYQNNVLKNRIHLLEAQNQFIQEQFDFQVENKLTDVQKIIDCAAEFITLKEENISVKGLFDGIKETDAGKAYLALKKAESELDDLKEKLDVLQQEVTAAGVQKSIVEASKKDVEDELALKKQDVLSLRQLVNQLRNKELQLKEEIKNLEKECANKDQELDDLQDQLDDTKDQLNTAEIKGGKVGLLEHEIKKMQTTQSHQPEIIKLSSQLGPIPPKYKAGPQDKEVKGAMDIDNIKKDTLDPAKEEFFREYNKRYGEARTASEIVIASFEYACNELFAMAKYDNNKIQLTNSGETPETLGMYALYRYMILDILKGGKVKGTGCDQGFKLDINSNVSMLPTQSEKILQYKPNTSVGLKPVVEVHYKQRDDFTPSEEALGLRDGVDAVSAKWILEQLSDEEMEYLFTNLMAPVIENTHPDYIKMRSFMQKKGPRVQLVETASELIQDLATALQKKFGGSVLVPMYNKYFDDWDVEPFIKKEDNQEGLQKIATDLIQVSTEPKIVDWELDIDVIGDKRQYDKAPRQQDFYDLIANARKKYQNIFTHMNENLLQYPQPLGKEFKRLEWNDVNNQYHVTHQMIGADFYGDGGERCLFSNLLAILVTDKSQLTSKNVKKLKYAMANYLDKLQSANAQWSLEKNKPSHLQSKNVAKVKELAILAHAFENIIRKTHHCTVHEYQNWLRGEGFSVASIDVSNLTSFEIQLAAYALGVRIGLLPIQINMTTKVDNAGRILPEGEIFGPNTKELFLMGICSHNGLNGTYYGLFPKMNLDYDTNEELYADPEALNAAIEIEDYWKSIPMKE